MGHRLARYAGAIKYAFPGRISRGSGGRSDLGFCDQMNPGLRPFSAEEVIVMKRFFPAAFLVTFALAGFLLAFQFTQVAAQAKPESAQHPAVTIEQVNRWE